MKSKQLKKQADDLLGLNKRRRKTRRGKKKKRVKSAKWKKEFREAMKAQEKLKKDFLLSIEKY
jgi:transposase-like protein